MDENESFTTLFMLLYLMCLDKKVCRVVQTILGLGLLAFIRILRMCLLVRKWIPPIASYILECGMLLRWSFLMIMMPSCRRLRIISKRVLLYCLVLIGFALWCLVKGPTWLENLSAMAFKPAEVLCVLIFEAFRPFCLYLYTVISSGLRDCGRAVRTQWDRIFRQGSHHRTRNEVYRYGGHFAPPSTPIEGGVEREASAKRNRTFNIDDSTAGLALAEYSSLLITDALAGILGEASDVDPISLAIAKTALMRAGMGQPPNPPKNNTAKLPSRSNSKAATSSVDLVKSKLNSASIERITPGENQSSSETTKKSFSKSLKQSDISCNARSKSSAATNTDESNTTIAAAICTKEIEVDRPSPAIPVIEAQSNHTIPSTEIPVRTNDFNGPTVLITANAESNTQAVAEDPSNLEMANETTIPQTEEELPLIDAEDTGRPENSHGGRDNDFGRNAPLANFYADGDVFGDVSDIDDYINDDSSVELPSSLFDPSTPTYLSEDDSDFTNNPLRTSTPISVNGGTFEASSLPAANRLPTPHARQTQAARGAEAESPPTRPRRRSRWRRLFCGCAGED